HHSGAEILGDDVGLEHQTSGDLFSLFGLEVDDDAALAAVEQQEEVAVEIGLVAVPELARAVAFRRALDLDDVGPEPGEHLCAGRAGLVVREVDDADSLERLAHALLLTRSVLLLEIRAEPHRLRLRRGIADHVDAGRDAGLRGSLERRSDVLGTLDAFAMASEYLHDPLVAREGLVAPGLWGIVRRPAPVVADHGEHRQLLPNGGLDLEAVHAKRAVSGERDDLLAGLRDLCPDRVGDGDTHASVRAGVDPVARHECRDRLSGEVQRVVAIDAKDRVALHESPDLVAEPKWMDRRRVAG